MDSIAWLAPEALLVVSRLLADGAEEDVAPACVLTWRGAQPAPDTLTLSELFFLNISPAELGRGPWLQAAAVPQVRRPAVARR